MESPSESSTETVQQLFENHLEFTSTHRGKVTRLPDAFIVEGDRAEFNYAVLGRTGDRSLLERFKTVHLIPSSGPWGQTLDDSRFEERGGLAYMVGEGDVSLWKRNSSLRVIRVGSESEMDDFSHVQAASFSPKQEDYERWHPWLRAANHRNLKNRRQNFYVGYLGDKPVGTTLLVLTEGIAGIYAVATLPEYRKQGVGSSLMAQAVTDARSLGRETISLQVAQGSYAETLYKRLGFTARFDAKIFTKI